MRLLDDLPRPATIQRSQEPGTPVDHQAETHKLANIISTPARRGQQRGCGRRLAGRIRN
jgi:hypothetical protein